MQQYVALVVMLFITLNASTQSTSFLKSNWIVQEEGSQINEKQFLDELPGHINLDASTSFTKEKYWQDEVGMRHSKVNQVVHGLPIEGAIYIIHSNQDGNVNSANGLLVKGEFPNNTNYISEADALKSIRSHFGDIELYADNADMESWLKSFSSDPNATFLPKGSLCYADAHYSSNSDNYRLTWKFDVYLQQEEDRQVVFVDALTGNIAFTQTGTTTGCFKHSDHCSHAHSVENASVEPRVGSGYTLYNGIQEFTADSVSPGLYVLRDEGRGQGITTLNAKRTTNINFAADFEDDDNFWDMRNQFQDEAAIDCHWGAEETYDYFLEKHNWNSYDGNGSEMISYVHWDFNWFNASWNGMFARFGDGNSSPLTYIDIVSHEFTHGLTGTTAGLIYQNESGALNESFSDIFGTTVEFFALGDTAPWTLGIPSNPFRDMSDPKVEGHPDTYLGANWVTGGQDNGGVHTNSGVQNYWFYLLTAGGSGINDNGLAFSVDSIGMDKAAAIAFRNLTTYLTPSSQYIDARYGSLQAARDLYGACSPEVQAVAQAWAAVGIGSPEITQDIQPVSITLPDVNCDLSDAEALEISFTLNPTGCDVKLEVGDIVRVGYQINDQPLVQEEIVLTTELVEGQTLTHDFENKMNLSANGNYDIRVWAATPVDSFHQNDTIGGFSLNNPVSYVESPARMIFRNFTTSQDSFYAKENQNSVAEISLSARNPATAGVLGFLMTGKDVNPNNIQLPTTSEEIFALNPTHASQICFCVDASTWKDVKVSFDKKQTFSAAYRQFIGRDNPQASALRLLLNNDQVGGIYHPTDYTDDPWEADTLSISQAAGTIFEFCFEGKHFIDRSTDRDIGTTTSGDNTYLDNISFFDPATVGVHDLIQTSLDLIPNPGTDRVVLNLGDEFLGETREIEVYNLMGLRIKTIIWDGLSTNTKTLDMEELPKGTYTITVKSERSIAVAQWVKG